MIPVTMTDPAPEGYSLLLPNIDSPVLLIITIAAAVAVSVLLDRLARKKKNKRLSGNDEATGGEDGKDSEETE